jgi:peptide/nickel transport system substrate-binding protein
LPERNVEEARQLLEEAGYADGFEITLGTPNDRFVNDHQIAQAVAGMWSRVGVRTNVDAKTFSAFIADRNAYRFSAFMAGWGSGTGEMSSPLAAIVATRDPERGLGGTNFARHSNPRMDALLIEALRTLDDDEREALLQEASRVLMDEYGIIPLHFEMTTWAMRDGLEYEPRADQTTLAYLVRRTE